MSDLTAPRGRNDEQAIDRLLVDFGLDTADDVRTELLELRALGTTAPSPSDAVRALMVGGAPATTPITTADVTAASPNAPTAVLTQVAPATPVEPTPVDELAARRRRKRRGAIAGLAVVVSLAGGATAAAASEGGIPGAFEHLGTAIGSVVSQFTGSSDVPAGPGPTPEQVPESPQPAPAQPAPATPNGPAGTSPGPQPAPGGGTPQQAPQDQPPQYGVPDVRIDPGNISIPTPPVQPPVEPPVTPPTIDPPKVGQDIPVPTPPNLTPPAPNLPAK